MKMEMELPIKNCQLRVLKTSMEANFPVTLEQSVRRLCEKEGFIKYKIDKRSVSTDGGNYLGILYEIDVKGRTKDGDKELHLFAKHIIKGDSLKILSVSNVYATEIFAYKELSKIFTELQEEANVPLEERYKMIKVYEESNPEAIIMENIAKKGFTQYYRMEVPPLNFFEISVKQLARFHGLSFILRERRPIFFSEKIKTLKNPFIFDANWIEMMTSLKEASLNHVDEKFKDKLEEAYESLLYKYSQYCDDENLNVCLRHGDYRPCNILIKIHDGDIQELIPVDYQLLHYGCPVFDFLYFIFGGTDREFRNKHLVYLKDLYYETLTTFLQYFDLDVEKVYSREEFERVYKEKLDFGLMTTLILLPFVFASENDVPDFSQSEMRFHIDDRIKERFHGVIEEYMDWGFL